MSAVGLSSLPPGPSTSFQGADMVGDTQGISSWSTTKQMSKVWASSASAVPHLLGVYLGTTRYRIHALSSRGMKCRLHQGPRSDDCEVSTITILHADHIPDNQQLTTTWRGQYEPCSSIESGHSTIRVSAFPGADRSARLGAPLMLLGR